MLASEDSAVANLGGTAVRIISKEVKGKKEMKKMKKYKCVYMFESRYQYGDWLCAMLVTL